MKKIKGAGFESIADFIKANLLYLPESQKRLFYSIVDIDKAGYQKKPDTRKNYQGAYYNGKG